MELLKTQIEIIKNTLNLYDELCESLKRVVLCNVNDTDFIFLYFTKITLINLDVKVEYQYYIGESYKDDVLIFPYTLINKTEKEIRHSLKETKLNNIELLDTWFIQSAIYDAKALFEKNKDTKIILE